MQAEERWGITERHCRRCQGRPRIHFGHHRWVDHGDFYSPPWPAGAVPGSQAETRLDRGHWSYCQLAIKAIQNQKAFTTIQQRPRNKVILVDPQQTLAIHSRSPFYQRPCQHHSHRVLDAIAKGAISCQDRDQAELSLGLAVCKHVQKSAQRLAAGKRQKSPRESQLKQEG